MKSYTVECRHKDFSKTILFVVADGVMPDNCHRFFTREDGSRVEVPRDGVVFDFGKERDEICKEFAEAEAKRKAKAGGVN